MGESMTEYAKYVQFHDDCEFLRTKSDKGLGDFCVEYIAWLSGRYIVPINILEIGRAKGYSFSLFRYFFPDSHVVSIDPRLDPDAVKVAELFDDNYLFITGTSDDLKDIDIKYDLVLIDGDHSYEWVKKDWENIQGKMNDGCIVLFHDIRNQSSMDGPRTVFENIKGFEKKKLIDKEGIVHFGVVTVGKRAVEKRPRYLVGPSLPLIKYFSRYGDCICYDNGANRHDLHAMVCAFKPDKIICILPEYYQPPEGIDRFGIPVVGIYVDVPFQEKAVKETVGLFDICITEGFDEGIKYFKDLGAKDVRTGFLCGVRPELCYDRGYDRDIDILFLGAVKADASGMEAAHDRRNRLLALIKEKFGEKYNLLFGQQSQEESADLTCRAKIVFHCSHNTFLSNEMISRRMFDVTAAGALCFHEEENHCVREFYEDGKEIVLYNDDNLIELLEYYLEHDEERKKIAVMGRLASRKWTYEANIGNICRVIENG